MSMRKIFEISGISGSTPTATVKSGAVLTIPSGATLNVAGTLNVTGSTYTVDELILEDVGRISTSSTAGDSLALDASTATYAEGMELRWHIADWSDVVTWTDAKGMYLRMENREATATGSIYGAEIYGVANNVNTKNIWGSLVYAYVKGASAKTITNVYAFQPEITFDASSATNTITDACVVRAKVTGGVMSDYTVLDGYRLTLGDMDGGSRTYGNGLIFEDDSDMDGTCALTTGININIGCTTAISVAGAYTTGISMSGDGTTAISITSGFTGTTGLLIAGTSTNAVSVTGSATSAFTTGTGTFGTGLTIGGTVTTGISIGACSGNAVEITADDKVQFRDATIYINSGEDGHLTIAADDTINLACSGWGGVQVGGDPDWGAGTGGTVLDGTGFDWAFSVAARVDSGALDTACAAAYHSLTVTPASHTTGSSFFGTWTELYIQATQNMANTSNVAAVWGQVEMGASVSTSDSSDCFTTGGYFNVISGASFTNNAAHVVNGVRVQSEISSDTITNSGRLAAFECLTKSGTYQSWDYGLYVAGSSTGIYMPGGSAFIPMQIGIKHSTTQGSGVKLAGDTDDTGGVQIYADDGGAAAVGDVLTPLRCRYLLTVGQTGGKTQCGSMSQLVSYGSLSFTNGGYRAAYIFNQASTITLAGSAEYVGINQATTLAGTMTVGSGCKFAGVDINIGGAGTISNSGTSAALLVRATSGSTAAWLTGIDITSATTNAININTSGIASARALNVNVAPAAANYGDGYAMAEFNLNPTGTGAGHMAALGAWANITAGTQGTGGAYICAQSNGVYEASTADVSAAKVVFGMRAQYQGDEQPFRLTAWSIHSPGKAITALYDISSFHNDVGVEASGGDSGGSSAYVRFMVDAGGNVKYIRLYDGTT